MAISRKSYKLWMDEERRRREEDISLSRDVYNLGIAYKHLYCIKISVNYRITYVNHISKI